MHFFSYIVHLTECGIYKDRRNGQSNSVLHWTQDFFVRKHYTCAIICWILVDDDDKSYILGISLITCNNNKALFFHLFLHVLITEEKWLNTHILQRNTYQTLRTVIRPQKGFHFYKKGDTYHKGRFPFLPILSCLRFNTE